MTRSVATRTPAPRAYGAAAAVLFAACLGGWFAQRRDTAVFAVTPADALLRIDPNRATRAELMLLPRIGPRLADSIIAYRDACPDPPAFHTAADLDRVPRIGNVTVAAMVPFLRFANAPRPATQPEPITFPAEDPADDEGMM
jgi:DNA uptake protein ComE-like DNA-binding protein